LNEHCVKFHVNLPVMIDGSVAHVAKMRAA